MSPIQICPNLPILNFDLSIFINNITLQTKFKKEINKYLANPLFHRGRQSPTEPNSNSIVPYHNLNKDQLKVNLFTIFKNPSKLSHCFLFCNCTNNRSFFLYRGRQSPAEPHSNRSVQYERFEAIVFATHSTLQSRHSNQTISQ